MQLITSLAVLASAFTSVNALGSAIINNNCAFPVYMWAVDAERNPSQPTVIAAGGSYSEQYHVLSSGGVSLKLSTSTSSEYITQFEYTVQSFASQPFVWYDGSDVNCSGSNCPFYNYGINLKTTNPSCPTRDCPVGQPCTGFYLYYNDDVNSLSCDDSADTIMTLCSVNTGASNAASSPQQKAAAAATTTSKAPIINEAVMTTFTTAYVAPTKRAVEPVHHGHMHFHQRAAQE
ncbi:uncharacterized protein PV09_03160 [Verruconis gallopava]|uniref:Antigenic thaumatin-like protein n=1 Tax=Verruconis gallopava TaxID=253628 RepID=A0A0D1XTE4_9PEZI|nr:uncharacterized protein PV09_03160 [Verruconis gallopava]KIW05976.1 hypothetical protein PV09_03160 [Verruconis gallopava]